MKLGKLSSQDDLRRQTLKSLLFGATSAVFGVTAWKWILFQKKESGIPWPLRKVLQFNEFFGRLTFSENRFEERPFSSTLGEKVRENGNIGQGTQVHVASWKINILSPQGWSEDPIQSAVTYSDLKRLPKTETTTNFRCIEGWSEHFSYSGVRFSDFMRELKIGTRSGKWPSSTFLPEDFFSYVGLETPDGKYFVSIDMESMLHHQTLIAYEINGVSLSNRQGAPARLIIPVKYGIKSLKRIGKIFFSDTQPPDYWAQRGYDWYSGL